VTEPIMPPEMADDAWIAPGATVVGDVRLGAGASVWFHATVRADVAPVRIGVGTNIQDGAVVHVDADAPCTIGNQCTLGHGAVVHGATLGDHVLVGIRATILSGAVVGNDVLIGAGALVTGGERIPDGVLVLGMPARVVRALSDEEREGLRRSARHYVANAARYRAAGIEDASRGWPGPTGSR